MVVEDGNEFLSMELETERKFPVDLTSLVIYYSEISLVMILKNSSLFKFFSIVVKFENTFAGHKLPSIVILSLWFPGMANLGFMGSRTTVCELKSSSLFICFISKA